MALIVLAVAWNFAVVLLLTVAAVTVNVAVVAPFFTVTDEGNDLIAADPEVMESATLVSAAGAASRVTVPVLVLPLAMEVGENASLLAPGSRTLNTTDWLVPLSVALMLAVAAAVTAVVVMVNVAVLALAAIVTVEGTLAAALSLVRAIEAPPDGAVESTVSVPVAEAVATTGLGVMVIEVSEGAFTTKILAAIPVAEPFPLSRPWRLQ